MNPKEAALIEHIRANIRDAIDLLKKRNALQKDYDDEAALLPSLQTELLECYGPWIEAMAEHTRNLKIEVAGNERFIRAYRRELVRRRNLPA